MIDPTNQDQAAVSKAALAAQTRELLEQIKAIVGPESYGRFAHDWRGKAQADFPTLQKAVHAYLSRPADHLPIQKPGAWLNNTWHRLREDAEQHRRAQLTKGARS